MRKVVDAVVVGGEPAPVFERMLNQILTRTRKTEQTDFRTQGFRAAVARESRVPYETVRRYFCGGNVNHFTRNRIKAAIRRLECKH